MNYETAKALKEAGFPQEGRGVFKEARPPIENDDPEYLDLLAYAPTLEELIEAIPMPDEEIGFFTISLIHGDWYAGYEKYGVFSPEAKGDTPTAATARLWLALKKV